MADLKRQTAFAPVLTGAEMSAVDKFTIETIGISGPVLMENAGSAIVRLIRERHANLGDLRIVILCGTGNNGGDGLVVARQLLADCLEVAVVIAGDPDKMRGDAALQQRIWQQLGQRLHNVQEAPELINQADLIIDAMLGTGARPGLRDPFRQLARAANAAGKPIISVDLPTGVDSSTGSADADAICANETVTFGACKRGHLLHPGKQHCGSLHLADIGFPGIAFESISPGCFALDANSARALMPQRAAESYKNRNGQVLVIAGSSGMAGAAQLCSAAVLRAGAGLCILGTPEPLQARLQGHIAEVMIDALPETAGQLAAVAWPAIERRLSWANVVAAGPGLGRGNGVTEIIESLIKSVEAPLVLDADALNAISGHAEWLQQRPGPTILTPHRGEFSRISGLDKTAVAASPLEHASEFAKRYAVHVVLKGAPTIVASADGRIFINTAGNPGMATAGMGDVLTGTIAGLAGQTDALSAALLGVYAHSAAADTAVRDQGELGLLAGDVLDQLGATLLKFSV